MASQKEAPSLVRGRLPVFVVSCDASDIREHKPNVRAAQAAWLVQRHNVWPAIAATIARLAFGGAR